MYRQLSPILLLSFCSLTTAAAPVVDVEEVVTRSEPANNGAGPLWCYGAPLIVRSGPDVFVSVIETGKDVPPLCNTRWQLWHRGPAGWQQAQHEEGYRQREPCPLAIFPAGPIFLSVNPSTQAPGTRYGPCEPAVLRFDPRNLRAAPALEKPAWVDGRQFTDHSYRGFAADGPGGELLLLNIHAGSGEQFVSHRDRDGHWQACGKIRFPIRSCYPQVGLRDRAAHVMAIGDIVEPNQEWRALKKEVLKQDWDYVFRRLFYAWTPDVTKEAFAEPIEIDSVENTGGHISNCDMHVDKEGVCHLLYIRRPHQYEFLRDKYFAGQPMTWHLMYVRVKAGKPERPRMLTETPGTNDGISPAFARFHVLANERLAVVLAGTPVEGGKSGPFGNFVGPLGEADHVRFERTPLEHPFHTFFTSAPRGGSAPSDTIDLFGTADDGPNLRYARLKLQ